MTLLGLLVMLMPLVAFGQSENCPEGYEEKEDPPTDITEDWGTATLVNPDADGKFTAVEFFVKDGYTLEVCVKGGNEGFTEKTIVGEDTVVVSTPTGQEVSHYEWTFTFTTPTTVADTTPTTVADTTPTTVADTTPTTVADTTPTTVVVITDEVGGLVVTPDEVLDTAVAAEELPFTGLDSDQLVGMGVLLLAGGLVLLGVTAKREDA